MKRILAAICAACALTLASRALPHAFLDHASPLVGSKVQASPAEAKLWFTQELEPAFSTVAVSDAGGKRIDRRDVKVEGDGTVLRVSLPPLDPGRYKVTWRVLSVDTHVTEGDFTFEVVR
jgi:methionine-rich copper-binding protein CopC